MYFTSPAMQVPHGSSIGQSPKHGAVINHDSEWDGKSTLPGLEAKSKPSRWEWGCFPPLPKKVSGNNKCIPR